MSATTTQELEPPPRRVRLRASRRVLRAIVWLLLLLVPGGVVAATVIETRDLQWLADEGVVVGGRVAELRSHKGRRSSRKYYVDYDFAAATRPARGSGQVPEDRWRALQVGDPIDICYWPADPDVNHLGRVSTADVDSAAASGWFTAGLLAAVLATATLLLERHLRRHLRLLRFGRALTGEVLSYEEVRRKGPAARLAFRFAQPAGGSVDGKDRLSRRLAPPPAPGDAIVVLQLRDDPRVLASLPKVLEYARLQPR